MRSHYELYRIFPFLPEKKVLVSDRVLSAPMPGLLVSLDIDAGDEVQLGQRLCALEAMKMETDIRASGSGTVSEISVQAGDAVKVGDVLLTLS